MAYGDSILDAAIRTYQPVDALGAIQGAQNVQMGGLRLKGAQNALEQQQAELDAQRQLSPLETALKKAQAKNQLFSNALATATDSSSFDQNMRALAEQGFPEAEQYVGRYTPVLQQRLLSVYGGQQGGQAGLTGDTAGLDQAPGTGAGKAAGAAGGLDAQFAQTTPEQRAASLERLTMIAQGLEQVNSPETWNALRQKLAQAGMPGMDKIGDYNPIKAASIYSRIQPVLSYLQNRAIADESGIPQPRVAQDIKVAGSSVFAIDPFTGAAKQIGQSHEFSAVADGLGGHIIYDKATGRTVGSGSGSSPGSSSGDDSVAPKIDPNSGSLTAQTGLSQGAINFLIGTPGQPRSTAYVAKINREITDWANKKGIDTSTFKAQATAYNNILQQNIQRNNQGKILENEIQGSVDNLAPMLDAANRGAVRYSNEAKSWVAQQVNDPRATQIADQLNRFRNEMAGYNAVAGGHLMQNGQPEPTPDDFQKADQVISTGINSRSIKALSDSIKMSADKNRAVLDSTLDDTRKAMWDLFGVGKNYKPQFGGKAGGGGGNLSAQDKQALDWANANPNDPRAAKIKAHLGQ